MAVFINLVKLLIKRKVIVPRMQVPVIKEHFILNRNHPKPVSCMITFIGLIKLREAHTTMKQTKCAFDFSIKWLCYIIQGFLAFNTIEVTEHKL